MATLQCCQPLVPLSWNQNQEMATTMQGVCSPCKTSADNIAPPALLVDWGHDIGREVGGGMWERQWCSK
eukprot:2792413-Ditylum_brightwellii.AAC.1